MQTIGQTALVPATLYATDGHGRLLAAEKVGLDGVGGVTKAQLPANNRGLEQGPTIAADDTPILNKIISSFFFSSSKIFFSFSFENFETYMQRTENLEMRFIKRIYIFFY